MPRETELARVDREWRELCVESIASLTEQVHELKTEIAVIKVKFAMVMVGLGMLSSVATQLFFKYVLK